ncbi:hypothetical protein BGZ70_004220 [Mortierella alpina]|uniref:Uncharacterized protein n=1 Tax=Mortierella alpina TaxID=64518 RepID=A0A9P6JA67_MORAP|nr:hypothetical protein BGZ70_004220 [Mortierella alpina]
MPPPPPGAASSMTVVGSSAPLHSMVRPGGPPPPPPTLAQLQLQQQQQRPPYAPHPAMATATGRSDQAHHPCLNIPFAAPQRPLTHPPASRQIVDALCDKLLLDPHFYHSVMDLASRRGFALHAPALSVSSSTPVASDPPPNASAEKHGWPTAEAGTEGTVAVPESAAQIPAKEPSAAPTLSKGQRKRRRNMKKTMEKRAWSYLTLLSQSMIKTKIKDQEVASKARLLKVNGWTGVDLAPERAAACRRKLQRGCKADPEFINIVNNQLDKMANSAKGDGSMDSKELKRKAKAFRNLAGYHDLIVKSTKADPKPSKEADRTSSLDATAAKQ